MKSIHQSHQETEHEKHLKKVSQLEVGAPLIEGGVLRGIHDGDGWLSGSWQCSECMKILSCQVTSCACLSEAIYAKRCKTDDDLKRLGVLLESKEDDYQLVMDCRQIKRLIARLEAVEKVLRTDCHADGLCVMCKVHLEAYVKWLGVAGK